MFLGERGLCYVRYIEEDEEKLCRVWGYNIGFKGIYIFLIIIKLMYKFY